jgi:hypothetical protein
MKKALLFLTILSILSSGWNWPTHQGLAENIYHAMPLELQNKLNLTLLKEGSIAPDKDFHDNVLHSYPRSYPKSLFYLEETKKSIAQNNYQLASYNLGVSSHYISDSFAAPHSVKLEPSKLHAKFEDIPIYFPNRYCNNLSYNLNETLYLASIQGEKDWQAWLETNSTSIQKKELESASSILFAIALDTFNTTCIHETDIIKIKKDKLPLYKITLIIAIATFSLFLVYRFKKSS